LFDHCPTVWLSVRLTIRHSRGLYPNGFTYIISSQHVGMIKCHSLSPSRLWWNSISSVSLVCSPPFSAWLPWIPVQSLTSLIHFFPCSCMQAKSGFDVARSEYSKSLKGMNLGTCCLCKKIVFSFVLIVKSNKKDGYRQRNVRQFLHSA